jgi:GT2 family glycosyltransferase
MLQILIIVGWVIAAGLLVYLVPQAARHRLISRSRKKSTIWNAKELEKHHDPDEKRQREVTLDRVTSSATREESYYYRRGVTIIGYLALFLWEGFWISNISDRFKLSTNPFQLPYFFLFVVLVGIPLAVYLFSRRIIRRSIHPHPDANRT